MRIEMKDKEFEKNNSRHEQSFTSTGHKLLHHQDAIESLRSKRNHPIVLHIMPTERCNLNCVFCSVAQRGESDHLFPDLTLKQIKSVVSALRPLGLKAVILSGGGEPCLYEFINELLVYLKSENLEIGIITNGVVLGTRITDTNLKFLSWIRISANAFDYVDDISIPKIKCNTTLGFSYIWNPLSSEKIIKKIIRKIHEQSQSNPISYVRMLPDCNLATSDLEKAHKYLRKMTMELGPPFFHQYKIHQTPNQCHLGRVHPVLYTDGYIYPCDSLVLNSPADNKKFHRDFALCRWDEIREFFLTEINGSLVNTNKCPNCVFCRQNELLMKIINSSEELPVPTDNLQHVNFI